MYLEKAKENSRASFKMMITYTLISQVLIFIRTKVLMVGTDKFFNANEYVTAFVAITYITEILASGLLLAIVPLLFKEKSLNGRDGSLDYINNIIHITFIFSLILIFLGYLLAPDIISMNDTGLSNEEFEASVKLFKIGLPMIVIILLKPVHIAFLQSNHGFKSGVKGGVYYNLIFIAYLVLFSKYGHEGLMIAAILAYASYYIVIIKSLKAYDFEHRRILDFKDPKLRELLYTLVLVILYLLVKRTVFELDANLVAQSGSIFGFLGNAVYIIDFVSIIVISVISTITYPLLAETYYDNNERDYTIILNKSIEIIINILMPVTVALLVFAEPTTKLFFAHGKGLLFKETILSPYELVGTIRSLRFMGIGILFLGLNLVLVRTLFSRGDFVSPIIITSAGLGINFVFGELFYERIGEEGVALAISISAITIGLMLIYKINENKAFIDRDRFISNIIVSGLFALISAIFVYIFYILLGQTDVAIMTGYAVGIFVYRILYKNVDKREIIV